MAPAGYEKLTLPLLRKKASRKSGVNVAMLPVKFYAASDEALTAQEKKHPFLFVPTGDARLGKGRSEKSIAKFLLGKQVQKKGQFLYVEGLVSEDNGKTFWPGCQGLQVCDGNTISLNCLNSHCWVKSVKS